MLLPPFTAYGGTVRHTGSGVKIASAVRDEANHVGVHVHAVEDTFASPRIRPLLLAALGDTAWHSRNGPRIANALRDEADHVGVHFEIQLIRPLLLTAHGTARHKRNGPTIASAVRDEADHVGVCVRIVEKGADVFSYPIIRLLLLESDAIRFVVSVLSRCDDVDESSILRESRWAHQGCPSRNIKARRRNRRERGPGLPRRRLTAHHVEAC